jgi:hypothetical protein
MDLEIRPHFAESAFGGTTTPVDLQCGIRCCAAKDWIFPNLVLAPTGFGHLDGVLLKRRCGVVTNLIPTLGHTFDFRVGVATICFSTAGPKERMQSRRGLKDSRSQTTSIAFA